MGDKHHAVLKINAEGWTGITDSGTSIAVGAGKGSIRPYELLLLALGGCLQATFEDVSGKMKVTWDSMEMDIRGEKRESVPTTLKDCTLSVQVRGASNEDKLKKAFGIAARYCSVYQTIGKVADMNWELTFI